MTDQGRADIVDYRFENAENTLKEVLVHCSTPSWRPQRSRLGFA